MAAYFDLRPEKTLKRPSFLNHLKKDQGNPNTTTSTQNFSAHKGGFYELFDSNERTPKPSRHFPDSYGYEKIWCSTRGQVPGAGLSHLSSDMMSKEPEQWKPSIHYVDSDSREWIYYQEWRPGKRQSIPKVMSPKEARIARKKPIVHQHPPNGPEWPCPKGPGKSFPKPQWEPPFRKGNNDDLSPMRSPRKHLDTYRDEYQSIGVKLSFDPKSSLPPVVGRRRLPSYRNEYLSNGVGVAMNVYTDYDC